MNEVFETERGSGGLNRVRVVEDNDGVDDAEAVHVRDWRTGRTRSAKRLIQRELNEAARHWRRAGLDSDGDETLLADLDDFGRCNDAFGQDSDVALVGPFGQGSRVERRHLGRRLDLEAVAILCGRQRILDRGEM